MQRKTSEASEERLCKPENGSQNSKKVTLITTLRTIPGQILKKILLPPAKKRVQFLATPTSNNNLSLQVRSSQTFPLTTARQ